MKVQSSWSATRAVVTALSLLVGRSAQAQISELSRSAVSDISRLTFGQLCEDRFILRNDGTKPIDAELGVAKSGEHTKIALGAHEQAEFTSKSKDNVELWVDGKLVATAEKERRSCKDVQGNAAVAVAPLEVVSSEKDRTNRYSNYPYFDPFGYGLYGPGFGYGYGALGWRAPFYTGFVGVPIIVSGGRGGGRGRR